MAVGALTIAFIMAVAAAAMLAFTFVRDQLEKVIEAGVRRARDRGRSR